MAMSNAVHCHPSSPVNNTKATSALNNPKSRSSITFNFKMNNVVWCVGIGLFLASIMIGIETTTMTAHLQAVRGNVRKQNDYIVTVIDEAGNSMDYDTSNSDIKVIPEGNDVHVYIDPYAMCPSVVREKVGLFDEKNSSSSVKDEFQDTILLVSSNYAYYNMLQNWEFLAHEHDLKWAVLALDEKLFEVLGPDRAIPPRQEFSVSGAYGWRQGNFQKLSCNKMRMAMEIANNCKVNVVFTDVDNIFLQNPFEHDLGRLIRSKRYDYLYQPNSAATEPRQYTGLERKPEKENNTGFYYIKHGSKIYKQIIEQTLEQCQDPNNKIDDQTLFWQEFWKVRNKLTRKKEAKFRHCKLDEYENPLAILPSDNNRTKIDSFQWCCLDPYYYPIGQAPNKRQTAPSNPDPVTYHANFARSYAEKVDKLTSARADGHGWDRSRFEDGVGGVLKDN